MPEIPQEEYDQLVSLAQQAQQVQRDNVAKLGLIGNRGIKTFGRDRWEAAVKAPWAAGSDDVILELDAPEHFIAHTAEDSGRLDEWNKSSQNRRRAIASAFSSRTSPYGYGDTGSRPAYQVTDGDDWKYQPSTPEGDRLASKALDKHIAERAALKKMRGW